MEQLGINPLIIGIQMFNFIVLLYVMKRLLYRPLMDVLEKRQQQIAASEELRSELNKERDNLHKEREQMVKETRKQAEQMVIEARQRGEKLAKQLETDAQKHAENLIVQGRKDLALREAEMWNQMRKEVKQVAIEVAEQVLKDGVTPDQQKQLADQSVRRLKEYGS
ncbi:F0F1 ATP synthase subunit B [candidate division WWE3 bacterium]|nr:F0F1 ATP synthase subunit B [candidate division WWE3 bacterium]